MNEISLPAGAYLLACDVDRNKVRDRQRVGYLARAAALTDLLLRGRLIDEDGVVRAVQGGSTGDDALDEVLGQVVADKSRSWRAWVRKDHRAAVRSIEEQLESAGVIQVESTRVPGLFPHRRVAVLEDGIRERLLARVDDACAGARISTGSNLPMPRSRRWWPPSS